ncbi:MAG: sulfatase-like hydrolase/transferase [Rudaea sp.]|uniref:sulfatase-like hydrolase/transferase n=1 Tax=unclassified Rudaea TaxID=2627037 RepID=UPI0010F4C66D|nr:MULTISPECIES: sulfatase-like hydrolase/transferase [unclassified Rudaea]MBN8886637.1 sulfatase-like hydrolase/transferase [Rudaea sp.]MBR0346118.1 sulfatase-like hydrolase/transferase [Rudaea sp.]
MPADFRGFDARGRRALVLVLAVLGFAAALMRATSEETEPGEILFIACLVLAFASALIFATRRIVFGLLLSAGFLLALRTISLVKMRYLQMPLFAPDLLYFSNGDTLDVVAHYPEIWHALVVRALLAFLVLGACIVWEKPLWNTLRRRPRIALQCSGTLLGAILLWGLSAPGGPFKHIHAKDGWVAINPNSPLTNFVLSLHRMRVSVPTPDPQWADRYNWGEAPTADGTALPNTKRHLPDIVVVLEESTFDPAILADCTIPECRSAMFEADTQTTAHGPLRVHTFGGATWTSEFTFFSGLPNTLFGPGGAYAPFNLAPRVRYALPLVLKQHGYRNIAVYPMQANFVNARRAYGYYGFDAFHDSSEFNLVWESPDLAIEQELEKIYRRERALTDDPLFVMLLTMRQHGPHNDPYAKLAKPFDHALFPQLDGKSNLHLCNYLARMTGSQEALMRLQAMLFAGGRPAILAHFGDHQPSFDGAIHALRSSEIAEKLGDARGLTYYMMRSNETNARKFSYPVLDLGFLAGLILDQADIPKGPFFTANAALRERCGGRYLDCPDRDLLDSYLSFVFSRLHSISR